MTSVTMLSPNAAGRGVTASAPAYLDRVAHQNKLTVTLVSFPSRACLAQPCFVPSWASLLLSLLARGI